MVPEVFFAALVLSSVPECLDPNAYEPLDACISAASEAMAKQDFDTADKILSAAEQHNASRQDAQYQANRVRIARARVQIAYARIETQWSVTADSDKIVKDLIFRLVKAIQLIESDPLNNPQSLVSLLPNDQIRDKVGDFIPCARSLSQQPDDELRSLLGKFDVSTLRRCTPTSILKPTQLEIQQVVKDIEHSTKIEDHRASANKMVQLLGLMARAYRMSPPVEPSGGDLVHHLRECARYIATMNSKSRKSLLLQMDLQFFSKPCTIRGLEELMEPPPSPWPRKRTWLILGAGAVAGAVGLGFGLAADIKSQSEPTSRNELRKLTITANASYGVAGAMLITALVLWFFE